LLARAGCDVALLDSVAERAEAVAKEVEGCGRRGMAITGDALDFADAERVVQLAASQLGGLDVCVNIIGLASWKSFLELDQTTWDTDLLGNLTHHFFIAQPAARIMVEQGTGGAIGMVGSVSGLFAAPDHGAYGAAKAGIFALVKTLAHELSPHSIRVNAVAPGSVRTPRIIAMQERGEAPSQQSDLDRMCECDDIGSAMLFLCSDLARKVTGQTLVVDAGVTTKFPFEVS
jgi:3-oxoacyl-[acyl-carrier protein] reductase